MPDQLFIPLESDELNIFEIDDFLRTASNDRQRARLLTELPDSASERRYERQHLLPIGTIEFARLLEDEHMRSGLAATGELLLIAIKEENHSEVARLKQEMSIKSEEVAKKYPQAMEFLKCYAGLNKNLSCDFRPGLQEAITRPLPAINVYVAANAVVWVNAAVVTNVIVAAEVLAFIACPC